VFPFFCEAANSFSHWNLNLFLKAYFHTTGPFSGTLCSTHYVEVGIDSTQEPRSNDVPLIILVAEATFLRHYTLSLTTHCQCHADYCCWNYDQTGPAHPIVFDPV